MHLIPVDHQDEQKQIEALRHIELRFIAHYYIHSPAMYSLSMHYINLYGITPTCLQRHGSKFLSAGKCHMGDMPVLFIAGKKHAVTIN